MTAVSFNHPDSQDLEGNRTQEPDNSSRIQSNRYKDKGQKYSKENRLRESRSRREPRHREDNKSHMRMSYISRLYFKKEKIISDAGEGNSEGFFFLNIFNLGEGVREQTIYEFYKDSPVCGILWNKNTRGAADIKFSSFKGFQRAVEKGDPILEGSKASIRSSYLNNDKNFHMKDKSHWREEYKDKSSRDAKLQDTQFQAHRSANDDYNKQGYSRKRQDDQEMLHETKRSYADRTYKEYDLKPKKHQSYQGEENYNYEVNKSKYDYEKNCSDKDCYKETDYHTYQKGQASHEPYEYTENYYKEENYYRKSQYYPDGFIDQKNHYSSHQRPKHQHQDYQDHSYQGYGFNGKHSTKTSHHQGRQQQEYYNYHKDYREYEEGRNKEEHYDYSQGNWKKDDKSHYSGRQKIPESSGHWNYEETNKKAKRPEKNGGAGEDRYSKQYNNHDEHYKADRQYQTTEHYDYHRGKEESTDYYNSYREHKESPVNHREKGKYESSINRQAYEESNYENYPSRKEYDYYHYDSQHHQSTHRPKLSEMPSINQEQKRKAYDCTGSSSFVVREVIGSDALERPKIEKTRQGAPIVAESGYQKGHTSESQGKPLASKQKDHYNYGPKYETTHYPTESYPYTDLKLKPESQPHLSNNAQKPSLLEQLEPGLVLKKPVLHKEAKTQEKVEEPKYNYYGATANDIAKLYSKQEASNQGATKTQSEPKLPYQSTHKMSCPDGGDLQKVAEEETGEGWGRKKFYNTSKVNVKNILKDQQFINCNNK